MSAADGEAMPNALAALALQPLPAAQPDPVEPLAILAVLQRAGIGAAADEVRLLATRLDPRRFRVEAVVCQRVDPADQDAGDRLAAAGVRVDVTPYHLGFDETVAYLASRLPAFDLVLSFQDVADIYPALEQVQLRPPLIERGATVAEARSGPKHFTHRYVGASAEVRPDGDRFDPARVAAIAPLGDGDSQRLAQWERLLTAVAAERPAPVRAPRLFRSFLQGGFECSTHRRAHDRARVDVIAATAHDAHAESDYRQLAGLGMLTVRDGLRWHLIEREPGRYDWSSLEHQLAAAAATGTEVIWDLLHYGWPDDLDIWSAAFVERFAAFAAAAARVIGPRAPGRRFYTPVNEISFFAWGGGDAACLNPFARGRGFELKVQLTRAALAAQRAIGAIDPDARFIHCDPVLSIVAHPHHPWDAPHAEGYRHAQFQGWDMLTGRMWPQLGGAPAMLDVVGVNFYPSNQWAHGGPPLAQDDPLFRPFRSILADVYARYGRPLFVAETGTEGDGRADWLRYIAAEVRAAMRLGVPVEGICLYPILNHPGWDDGRDCPNGLLGHATAPRPLHEPLAAALREERARFAAWAAGG